MHNYNIAYVCNFWWCQFSMALLGLILCLEWWMISLGFNHIISHTVSAKLASSHLIYFSAQLKSCSTAETIRMQIIFLSQWIIITIMQIYILDHLYLLMPCTYKLEAFYWFFYKLNVDANRIYIQTLRNNIFQWKDKMEIRLCFITTV